MSDNAAKAIKARSSSSAEFHEGDMYPHHERRAAAAGCLDSTATDVTINSIFFHGGPGATGRFRFFLH